MTFVIITSAYCALVLPLGDAGTVCHACLIFTIIFSRLLLNTPISWWKAAWTVIIVGGLIAVVKPTALFGAQEDKENGESETMQICSGLLKNLFIFRAPFLDRETQWGLEWAL